MTLISGLELTDRAASGHTTNAAIASLACAAFVLGVIIAPTQVQASPPATMATSNADFKTWQQGFEHGTDGWYDATTPGPLGWCGSISAVTSRGRSQAEPTPSAGSSYATVSFADCNAFWGSLGVLGGAPYGPGPDLSLYSQSWPEAGYVTELDVYLDPAWSGELQGNFEFAGSSRDTLIQFVATIFPTAPGAEIFHTGPHYFIEINAVPGEQALSVLGHRIGESGWYTLRFVFDDEDGEVNVDAQIGDTGGRILASRESIAPYELIGPFKVPDNRDLNTADYGSGHVWLFDIALGLDLPIDEHRVRPGR